MIKESESRLLSRFPKKRPELPVAYQRIYNEHYVCNRSGSSPATGAAKKLESWMHRKVAADVAGDKIHARTLEIGSGNLNHLPYEPSVQIYDVVEPFEQLAWDSPYLGRISKAYRDVNEIQDATYDRIVSIAAFEHLDNLPQVVAKCGTLLSSTGVLRIAVPSEGTFLWGLGWRLTTGIEFRLRHNLSYAVLMRHEHLNSAKEIFGVLSYFFRSIKREVFGVSPALSLYQFFECRSPLLERCSDYLSLDRTM
jgi:hypothetical protein